MCVCVCVCVSVCVLIHVMVYNTALYVTPPQSYYDDMDPENLSIPLRLRGKREAVFGNLLDIYKFHDRCGLSALVVCLSVDLFVCLFVSVCLANLARCIYGLFVCLFTPVYSANRWSATQTARRE